MSVTWEDALEACEARLDAATVALDQGTPAAMTPFSAPDVEGPIPPALVDRARACSARGDALSVRVADELERIRRELRRLPRMPRTAGATRFEAQA